MCHSSMGRRSAFVRWPTASTPHSILQWATPTFNFYVRSSSHALFQLQRPVWSFNCLYLDFSLNLIPITVIVVLRTHLHMNKINNQFWEQVYPSLTHVNSYSITHTSVLYILKSQILLCYHEHTNQHMHITYTIMLNHFALLILSPNQISTHMISQKGRKE